MKNEAVIFAFDVILDPLTREAQLIAPVLETLNKMQGVSLRLFLNPISVSSEIPSTFYKGVISLEIDPFNEPVAVFDVVPLDLIVTQSLNGFL